MNKTHLFTPTESSTDQTLTDNYCTQSRSHFHSSEQETMVIVPANLSTLNGPNLLPKLLRIELNLDHYIEFANIQRVGPFQRGKPRPNVARFIYHSDFSTVLEMANWLKGTPWGVHRQFPATVDQRRSDLSR